MSIIVYPSQTHLYRDETRANDDLRSGSDERGSLGGVFASIEDTRDSVSFGEQSGVHDREAESGSKPKNQGV